jgi:hypothetical protein
MQTVQDGPARTVREVTPDEIRSWPATVDIVTGLAPWGCGRDAAYKLAATGEAPVPILRIGRRYRISRAAVMTALGIAEAPPAGALPPEAE